MAYDHAGGGNKVLDAATFLDYTYETMTTLQEVNEQLANVLTAVEGLVQMEDQFAGEGGEAIRAFYQDFHTMILLKFQLFINEYVTILDKINSSLRSYESSDTGFVRETFINFNVEQGLTKVKNVTQSLSQEANSVIASISDIVSLSKLNANPVLEDVKSGEDIADDTVEGLHHFDQGAVQSLQSIQQDLADLTNFLRSYENTFTSSTFNIREFNSIFFMENDYYRKMLGEMVVEAGLEVQETLEFEDFENYRNVKLILYEDGTIVWQYQLEGHDEVFSELIVQLPEGIELPEDGPGTLESLLSLGVDFIPVVGNIKGGYEAIGGVDPVTGEELSGTERVLAGFGIIFGGLSKLFSKGIKTTGKFVKGTVKNSDIAQSIAKALEKAVNSIGNLSKGAKGKIKDNVNAVSKKTDEIVGNAKPLSFKNASEYFDYFNSIAIRTDLTNEEKFELIHKAYEALENKGDVTVVADMKYLKPEVFVDGKFAIDWPKYYGFVKESVQPITRENPLPEKWDRIGGIMGQNFTTIPENGIPYTYEQRAIPYLENPSARHVGTFNNEAYFDAIDAIRNGDLEGLNKIIVNNGKDPLDNYEFNRIQIEYFNFINNEVKVIGDIDATYGVKGIAAPWISSTTGEILMEGGAEQILTPLNAYILELIGLISKY